MVRSEQCSLTAKAYTASFPDTSTFNILWSQWDYHDSTTLNKNFALVGDGTSSYNVYQLSFSSTYQGNEDLVWGVDIYDSSGNTMLYYGEYNDVGQVLVVGLPTVVPSQYSQYTDIVYRCRLYVKKKDGSNIYRDHIHSSNITWYFNRTEDIEQSTLPAEWLTTVTNNIENPFETMTTIVPPEMDFTDTDLSPFVTIPEKITFAINMFLVTVGQLLQLKYMTFTISFILIVCLFAWLLH